MRTRFQQGLDDLRQRLLRMGCLAEQAVDRARQAYVERDLTRCQMVLEGESLTHLFDVRDDVILGQHHPFGIARAATRENDRGEVIEGIGG